MICKHIFLKYTVKLSNLSIFDNLVYHKLTKLNGYKYCYVSQTFQANISHLLNDQTVQFLTTQLNLSYLFMHSLNGRQF